MPRQRHFFNVLLLALWAACAGCSTSFKYTPSHDQTYPGIASREGLAIPTGEDLRPDDEKQPEWCKNAEPIVARALADEVRHAQLFRRVKVHSDKPNPAKYPEIIRFRVKKFECRSQPRFLESTGQSFLRSQGFHGEMIAKSIPTQYVSEVEIEFEILDAATQRPIFAKTYSASHQMGINGYQGEKPKIQQTSAVLETVLTQFVADLAQIPEDQQVR